MPPNQIKSIKSSLKILTQFNPIQSMSNSELASCWCSLPVFYISAGRKSNCHSNTSYAHASDVFKNDNINLWTQQHFRRISSCPLERTSTIPSWYCDNSNVGWKHCCVVTPVGDKIWSALIAAAHVVVKICFTYKTPNWAELNYNSAQQA